MFQSFDEKVANVSLAFELMMDGGLPQPKVTDIDGDANKMEVMMKIKVMEKNINRNEDIKMKMST